MENRKWLMSFEKVWSPQCLNIRGNNRCHLILIIFIFSRWDDIWLPKIGCSNSWAEKEIDDFKLLLEEKDQVFKLKSKIELEGDIEYHKK